MSAFHFFPVFLNEVALLYIPGQMNGTSFSVFHTEVNSEYWSQSGKQIANIHSTELDVYDEKQSASNSCIYIIGELNLIFNLTVKAATTKIKPPLHLPPATTHSPIHQHPCTAQLAHHPMPQSPVLW